MNMLQSFKLALKSIRSNKMRSFLTMLGIIIGVASVIILVSLVSGYMSYMTDSFASLGTNQINVSVTNISSRSVSADQMYEFYEDQGELFDHMSPVVNVNTVVKHGNDSMSSTSVAGVSEEYLDIKGVELEQGRNIQYSDIVSRQKVCVAGYYVAGELYGSPEKAIDQTIKIGGYGFRIVGVARRQDEEAQKDGGADDFVWIPYSCGVKMSRNANIGSYVFTIRQLDTASEATKRISDFLQEIFKNEDLYQVTAMSEMLDSLNSMIAMVSAGLGGIAGISLLVAGVGVMNIMLVSVTERTREIGIRKALGARKGVILQQFVIEAAVQSAMGGVIGIVLGSAATAAVGTAVGLDASPSPSAVVISFSVSVFIGLFFGYMPARRAAGLNPIDALRSE